jgi:hypothetical protein
MRVTLFLVAAILAVPIALAQELSVEKCRADAKQLDIEVHRPNADQASYFVWATRADEMSKCQDVDQVVVNTESFQRGLQYFSLEAIARVMMIERLNNFIHRHGLQKQFIDDDQSGLR